MARKKILKVDQKYCDFCEKEACAWETWYKCAICGKNMCKRDGMAAHSTFQIIGIRRYADNRRLPVYYNTEICEECAKKKFKGTIGDLFNRILDGELVSGG